MDARNKGIEVVYQDLALCDNLTAASNIFLTREIKRNFGILKIIAQLTVNNIYFIKWIRRNFALFIAW